MEIVDRAEEARIASEKDREAAIEACKLIEAEVSRIVSWRKSAEKTIDYDLVADFTFYELHLQGEAIRLARRALNLAYPDYTVGDLKVWYNDQEGGHTETKGIQIHFGRISLWERFWRFLTEF